MAPLRRKRGVTLIELIVVLLIIAGLIGLLFPAIIGLRETAREASCRNNLHQLRLAMQQFLDTNQGSPRGSEWPVQLLPYLEESSAWDAIREGRNDVPRPSVYTCPSHPGISGDKKTPDPNLYTIVLYEDGPEVHLRFVDRSTDLSMTERSPWTFGPLLSPDEATREEQRMTGPHRAGKFQASPWLKVNR